MGYQGWRYVSAVLVLLGTRPVPGQGQDGRWHRSPNFFGPRSNRSSVDIQVSEVEEAYNNSLYSLAGPRFVFCTGPSKTWRWPCWYCDKLRVGCEDMDGDGCLVTR
jgi:hypothetical protein